jgi:hypothetical protein
MPEMPAPITAIFWPGGFCGKLTVWTMQPDCGFAPIGPSLRCGVYAKRGLADHGPRPDRASLKVIRRAPYGVKRT